MNYLEQIRTITKKIHLFGGTTIGFDDDFYIAQRRNGGKPVVLYSIEYSDMVGLKDLVTGEIFYMPLHHFSENLLLSIYIEYKVQCKMQLTEKAYKEIITALGKEE